MQVVLTIENLTQVSKPLKLVLSVSSSLLHTLQLVRSLTPLFPYDPVCLAFVLSLATALLLSAFFAAALLSQRDEAL